ncbi:MAG: SsrA-binding protein SmpB [Tidjanibacter sp.]|jgi:SsrA-binding protein|nr:SsrA-binding protein SmpB [Tidjanibacter sp.]MBQ5613583.1 SsrA-binding protein SmpB [Tidjanibacter sp.]MBQ6605060.1 SsrA-binding protein SmpB [Tidjanibacter sp.]
MSVDKEKKNNINIKNKKAYFDYEILEEYVAGIQLAGTEIKALRQGKASLVDCYCYMSGGEMFVRGMNIAEYDWGTYNNHIPKRDRKLLLNRKELNKIERTLQDKGITAVGLRIFINERGLAKLLIGVARGKKQYDKRETLKEKDAKREMDRFSKR